MEDLVRVLTICQGSIVAHEGAILRPDDACLSRSMLSGASHSFTQEAFFAHSLLQSSFIAPRRSLRLSFPLVPTKSYPLCCRLDGRGKRGREQRPRMCRAVGPLPVGRAGVASFSSSRMYSQDGSIETTRCLLTLSVALSLSDSQRTQGVS